MDCRMPQRMIEKLSQYGKVFRVSKNPIFSEPVSAHPDMNFLQIGGTVFTVSKNLPPIQNICSIPANTEKCFDYPNDVRLNAVCIGEDFLCRKQSIDPAAFAAAAALQKRMIFFRQGYVKCSIAVVCEEPKAIITEDAGIARTLIQYGYEVLLLPYHAVKLAPYEYGFIGGACGLVNDKLLFTGNIEAHPDYPIIASFCARFGVRPVSLSDEPLYDYGSILQLACDDKKMIRAVLKK